MLAKFQWTDERNPLGAGVLVSQGAERKLIGAAELIWTPVPKLEIGTRYAMRRTQAEGVYPDRKSTRLNSSHLVISYAVFCLKKKKKKTTARRHVRGTQYRRRQTI